MLCELLLDPVGISGVLIHFVYSNYYRNACCLCMVDRLDRLRHDTVVGSNNEDSDISDIRTSCSHRGERLVSRSIQKRYLLALVGHLISTDMLSDTACLTVGDMSVSYLVKYRGLTVVNVTHNNDNRASRLEILLFVRIVNNKSLLDSNDNFLLDLCAQLISHDSRRIEVNDLVYACHYAQTHKLFDNYRSSDFKS